MANVPFTELIENAEEISTEVVPVGKYPSRVLETEWVKTKTDKDMLKVVFEIAVGPNKGRKLYANLVISPESPKGLGFFFKDMETLGVTKAQLAANGADWAAEEIIGNLVELVVKHGEYQNRPKAEVQWINVCKEAVADVPASANTPPPLETPPAAPAGDTPPPPPFAS